MNDPYLWDRTGSPDPQITRLEKVLSRFRHQEASFKIPEEVESFYHKPEDSVTLRPTRSSWAWTFAEAALVIIALTGLWFMTYRPSLTTKENPPSLPEGVHVTFFEGRSSSSSTISPSKQKVITTGEWIEMDRSSRAQVKIGTIGSVELLPNSRARLKQKTSQEHRFELAQGKIVVDVTAPPRFFVIETSAGQVFDLGCAYTLEIHPGGIVSVEILKGKVSFEKETKFSWIPAGAKCQSKPTMGPGAPYFPEALVNFQRALFKFNFENGGKESIDVLLAEARKSDTLTLWHLISRVDFTERERIINRITAFSPLPKEITKEGILQLDPSMMNSWFEHLEKIW